jgi:uncharacterized repeat protein (TIGR01451 family)
MTNLKWSVLFSFRNRGRKKDRGTSSSQKLSVTRLWVEPLEDRTLPSITGFAFGGLNYSQGGATPPDTIAAAGPNNVVEGVNDTLLFLNKAGMPNNISGTTQAFTDFFSGFTHSFLGFEDVISDPSVNYDTATGKWIISILDIDLQHDKGYLDVAVSTSSDPTGSWNKFQVDLTTGHGPLISGNAGLTLWGDFDRFGSSANAYVWTVNMFSFDSSGSISAGSRFDHVQIIALDKSNPSLAGIHTIDVPGWNGSTITNENMMPVRMDAPTLADGMWFAEETNYGASSGQANALRLVHVGNILTATSADFVSFTGNVPTYQFTPLLDSQHPWNNGDTNNNAVQKGSTDLIDTNDTRINSAVWRTVNGQQHLVLTQTVADPAEPTTAKVRWYDFNTTGATNPAVAVPLYQTGEINPGAGVFTYFPSAAIDPAGDIAVNYLESSANEYMSMYITGKALSESTMEAGVLVAGGDGPYTGAGVEGSPHRAGDFSGAVEDVNSSGAYVNSFWSANEYASGGIWGTALTNYSIANPLPATDVAVSVSPLASVTAGANATYTITVTNNGPNAAQGVVLSDVLPAGSTFVSMTQTSGTDAFTLGQSGGTVTETASGTIASGGSDTFTLVVSVPGNLANGSSFSDTASVSVSNPDSNTANNSATVTSTVVNNSPGADVAVSVSGPASANEGDNVIYTITLTNAGPGAASGVTVTDTLPANLSYKSATAGQGTFSVANGVVTYSVGSIAAGGSVTLTVTAQATEDGSATDTASVSSSNSFDPNSANNSASATTAFAEPAIVVSGPIQTTSRSLSNFQVATFTHASGVEPASAFTATINWGDGKTSTGTITLSGTTYKVTGTHTYSKRGTYTITTSVAEVAAAPTIGVIAASPNPVPGTSTQLTVSATDADATITAYTWSVQSGPSGVTFDSNNGMSNASSETVHFSQAGTYTFLVKVTNSSNQSSTSTVTVTVQQTLTSITVAPATVTDGASAQLSATAIDQFGNPLATQPSFVWTLVTSGGAHGRVSSSGLYAAPSSGSGFDTAQAASGGVSRTGTVTFVAPAPPAAPTGLTATPGNAQVSLSWTASAGAMSYRVYRGTATGQETLLPTPTITGTSYIDSTAANGTTYYYEVSAVGAGGEGSLSSEVSATPSASLANVSFVNLDSGTEGNWSGIYGADGYNVSQDASLQNPTYPSYAQVSFNGQAGYTWASTTTDARALQKPENLNDRIAGTWYGSSFTIDVNLTDGNSHQIALYVLDWDGSNRAETIKVLDATTGTVLDTRALAAGSFTYGEYLVWNIQGHVKFEIDNNTGSLNAVVSGLFFGTVVNTPNPGSASFVKIDATTQGTWNGVYGADGYNVSQDVNLNTPAYARVSYYGEANQVWAGSTTDVRALQKPENTSDRIAGAWYSGSSFTIDVNLTDGNTHQVGLYVLDWDTTGRAETIKVLDAATGTVLNSQTLAAGSFHNGEYLVWNIQGHVKIEVDNNGGTNAVVSGLFFDPVGSAPHVQGDLLVSQFLTPSTPPEFIELSVSTPLTGFVNSARQMLEDAPGPAVAKIRRLLDHYEKHGGDLDKLLKKIGEILAEQPTDLGGGSDR